VRPLELGVRSKAYRRGMTVVQGEQSDLTVSALATSVGVRPDTIRYYERVGLLPPPPRTRGHHRRYGPAAVDRLLFIQGAQRLGLRLREIRDLLGVRDTGTCPCGPAEPVLRRHLVEVDLEIERLSSLRRELADLVGRLPGQDCPDPLPGTWCPLSGGGGDDDG
jgi:DNA-binding transcriptional MerR regulator